MKKTFPLKAPGKDDARVRDKIRHEIRKYVRRERKKPVPEGFEEWEIACKVGASAESAEVLPLKEVGGTIDKVAATGATAVYVEVVAVAAQRARARPN
jgi:hypothetical protein